MNWLNLELKTLRSTEYLGADPIQRATWINLLSFCADHENGGVIEEFDNMLRQMLALDKMGLDYE